MASQKSQNNPGMKQKSLMGWLSQKQGGQANANANQEKATEERTKGSSTATSSSVKKDEGKGKGGASKMGSTSRAIENSSKGSNAKSVQNDASSKPTSSPPDANLVGSSSFLSGKSSSDHGHDTPPTSEGIDVDMLSDDDAPPAKPTRIKRKIVLGDSDNDDVKKAASSAKPSSDVDGASPPPRRARMKKPRMSSPVSDEDDEDEIRVNFSSRLSRFKKPAVPTGRGRRSNASSEANMSDSDFNPVPDDSDADIPATSSRRGSSITASRSEKSSCIDSASELSDVPKKSKKPVQKKGQTGGEKRSTAGANSFLTAAERRALEKKSEKKSTEDAFEFLKDVRDKDGNRPGEPGYDPRTLYIPKSAWKSFTPFETQFWEIKQNHYDTVLFFQKGKFLELYEDDARIGHQQFDLKLTERVKMSMVGVPESSFNFWAAKFLAKGYKVGRVDQAETALGAEMRLAADKGGKGKRKPDAKAGDKIVRRELNKVYTNGTLVDAELLTDEQAGHCVSIREQVEKNTFGVCVLDCSTSEFNLCAFEDDACRTKLETLMRQLRPKEILFTKGNLSVATNRLLKMVLPGSCLWTSLRECEGYAYSETLQELKKLYPNEDEDEDMDGGLGSSVPEAIRSMVTDHQAMFALGAMMWYLKQLNIDKDILSMKNFNIYDPMRKGQGLVLDGQTLAHIEVLLNSEGTDDASLLRILDRCITPFGKRLFRIWLCMPLREVSAINDRLDAVEDLIEHPNFETDFSSLLKYIPDLERIISRIHAKSCKVKDFLKVLSAFKRLSKGVESLLDIAENFESKGVTSLLRSAPDVRQNIKHIEAMFKKPDGESDDLVPEEGVDERYDEVMSEIKALEKGLDKSLKKLEDGVGFNLTYWHSAIGTKDIYLVQTKAGQKGIPRDWTKNGGTKAYGRWNVPSLAPSIRSLKEARENQNSAIKAFRLRVFAEFDQDRDIWLRFVKVLAELDCLLSLTKASKAFGEPACRPEFVVRDDAVLDFEELRHPAMCLRKEDFIPNDVKMGGEVGRVLLLTGPNMGGKSTVMRMTAVGVIIAQLGMLVPAKKARISPVDAILTRMGAYDNMFSNASTFKVELDECCKILREATPKSLVILDELGRGTSTYDGMAIAGAVLHQLATHALPLSFFATHYGSLTDDFAYHPNIRNMHMSTIVDDDKCELVFLYKLVEGIAPSSFGTHVANLAGVPMEVVKRAELISTDFAKKFKERIEGKRTTNLPLCAQADFVYLVKLAKGEIKLPTDPLKKKEVLNILRQAVGRYVQAN